MKFSHFTMHVHVVCTLYQSCIWILHSLQCLYMKLAHFTMHVYEVCTLYNTCTRSLHTFLHSCKGSFLHLQCMNMTFAQMHRKFAHFKVSVCLHTLQCLYMKLAHVTMSVYEACTLYIHVQEVCSIYNAWKWSLHT